MAGTAWPLICLTAVFGCAYAVHEQDLEDWFASPYGLAMARSDARSLASKEWQTLTQCGVTIASLRGLKDVLYKHDGMDLDLAGVRREILPLAEHHAPPEKLDTFYRVLSSSVRGLALAKVEAQGLAISLVKDRAEPDQLQDLYAAMFGSSGVGFDRNRARTLAIQQARAGADAVQFKRSYLSKRDEKAAVKESVNANMHGLIRRYAKDAKLYTAPGFQEYYGTRWLSEWLDAPMELRVARDGHAYTASEFAQYYGSQWFDEYRAAAEATQMRLANDGKAYNVQEFRGYYGDEWQRRWDDAAELPCTQCKPFGRGAG
eukprot:CAMPEP_0198543382 /NCGR_PEP_ID=MMETSP1462-20131121/59635_1 /TAXON_ID=1333877 /ORGANISM="Brandtodinium nutriculum, Strain RCC3387" /LENGTH=316 /DNA_ID=CAMNT_0044273657 /DNA_START=77 /DNA_END=1023 /DNA_ORIENTATION=+